MSLQTDHISLHTPILTSSQSTCSALGRWLMSVCQTEHTRFAAREPETAEISHSHTDNNQHASYVRAL